MKRIDLYWKSNREWWEYIDHIPTIKDSAPPEAKASYLRYLEQMNESEQLYMVMDDTIDIGKEAFPPVTKADECWIEWAKSLKDKYMKGNQPNRDYVDAIVHYEMTPEEREEELKRLKEESDKLTEWPKM